MGRGGNLCRCNGFHFAGKRNHMDSQNVEKNDDYYMNLSDDIGDDFIDNDTLDSIKQSTVNKDKGVPSRHGSWIDKEADKNDLIAKILKNLMKSR